MKTYRVRLVVELELDAFAIQDARDLAEEAIKDIEGLGVTVTEVTVADAREI